MSRRKSSTPLWVLLHITISLTQLQSSETINCEQQISPGGTNSHVSVTATCYPNGMVEYNWFRNHFNVELLQIDYNCSYSDSRESYLGTYPGWTGAGNGRNTVNVPLSNSSEYSCKFGGCYYYNGVDYTFGIPSATCSRYSSSTVPSASRTQATSTPSNLVPTATIISAASITPSSKVQPSIQPSFTPTYSHINRGLPLGSIIGIGVAAGVAVIMLAAICTGAVIVIVTSKRTKSRKKFDLQIPSQLSVIEPVKASEPPPRADEDNKTIFDPLFDTDKIDIIPLSNSPFPNYHTVRIFQTSSTHDIESEASSQSEILDQSDNHSTQRDSEGETTSQQSTAGDDIGTRLDNPISRDSSDPSLVLPSSPPASCSRDNHGGVEAHDELDEINLPYLQILDQHSQRPFSDKTFATSDVLRNGVHDLDYRNTERQWDGVVVRNSTSGCSSGSGYVVIPQFENVK